MRKVIFSKDRPLQLDLLIRSMLKHWDINDTFIIYTYSNDDYGNNYLKLNNMYSKLKWIKQENFKNDLLKIIEDADEYIVFLVDDIVITDNIHIDTNIFNNNDVLCISLRLGKNITQCYTKNIKTNPPKIENGLFFWNDLEGDWKYPMSVDGNIFRKLDIHSLLEKLNYSNPNTLEGVLSKNPIKRKKMFCFEKSKLFNIPCNKVQTVNRNKCGHITTDFLNKIFNQNMKIDLESIEKIITNSCHKEINFKYVPRSNNANKF
jgi:hypothetical protein